MLLLAQCSRLLSVAGLMSSHLASWELIYSHITCVGDSQLLELACNYCKLVAAVLIPDVTRKLDSKCNVSAFWNSRPPSLHSQIQATWETSESGGVQTRQRKTAVQFRFAGSDAVSAFPIPIVFQGIPRLLCNFGFLFWPTTRLPPNT